MGRQVVRGRSALVVVSAALLAMGGMPLAAQDYASMPGEEFYRAACAACHGSDGTGAPADRLGFDLALSDFTDCCFAAREADADWLAVAHAGGPVRGFAAMMPAFGDVLSDEQLLRILSYILTLCGDGRWPRGELNLPGAFVTEKAYPEDEVVWSVRVALAGLGSLDQELVYERRFGPLTQLELVVPFALRKCAQGSWTGGVGDLALGVKHVLLHSLGAGSILSPAGELKLPTSDADRSFGAGTPAAEVFISFGQLIPADGFVQLQAVAERPFDTGRVPNETALRVTVGRTWTQARWARAWSPMVELLGSREPVGGEAVTWDLLPQLQVSLNTRQHVLANVGIRLPLTERTGCDESLELYLLWDWFDGGLRDGW